MQDALVELCAILTLDAATSIPVNGPPRVYWFGMRWSRGSFPGNSSPPTLRIHFVLTPGLALVLCFLPQCCIDAAVAGCAFDLCFFRIFENHIAVAGKYEILFYDFDFRLEIWFDYSMLSRPAIAVVTNEKKMYVARTSNRSEKYLLFQPLLEAINR